MISVMQAPSVETVPLGNTASLQLLTSLPFGEDSDQTANFVWKAGRRSYEVLSVSPPTSHCRYLAELLVGPMRNCVQGQPTLSTQSLLRQHCLAGRAVLEVGAGSGVVGLAAANAGHQRTSLSP